MHAPTPVAAFLFRARTLGVPREESVDTAYANRYARRPATAREGEGAGTDVTLFLICVAKPFQHAIHISDARPCPQWQPWIRYQS